MAKPSKTKVKLRKLGDQLNILVPRKQKLNKEGIHQVVITTVIDAVTVLLMGFNIWVILNIQRLISDGGLVVGLLAGLLFSLPLGLWMMGAAFKNSAEMCKQLFSDTSVSIDQKHMALSTQFSYFDWGTLRRIKVKDITRVIVTEYQYIEGVDPSKSPCFVVLELDSGTLNLFNVEHGLSKAEAKWLGKEISRWLNIGLVME
jgi:hypothetical protein